MTLYANGCSITMGTELFTLEYPQYIRRRSLANTSVEHLRTNGLTHLADINERLSYPGVMANRLGKRLVNRARNGASNELIAITTIADLTELLKTTPAKDIIAVIGWSSIDRRSLVLDYGFTNIIPSSLPPGQALERTHYTFLQTHLLTEYQLGLIKYYKGVRLVNDFCALHRIRVVMFNALFYLGDEALYQTLLQSLRVAPYWQGFYKNYVSIENHYFFQTDTTQSLEDLVRMHQDNSLFVYGHSHDYDFCTYGHPGKALHAELASHLIAHLKEIKEG